MNRANFVMKINLDFTDISDKMHVWRVITQSVTLESCIAHAFAFMLEYMCKNACRVVWVGVPKSRRADDIKRGIPRVVCRSPEIT